MKNQIYDRINEVYGATSAYNTAIDRLIQTVRRAIKNIDLQSQQMTEDSKQQADIIRQQSQTIGELSRKLNERNARISDLESVLALDGPPVEHVERTTETTDTITIEIVNPAKPKAQPKTKAKAPKKAKRQRDLTPYQVREIRALYDTKTGTISEIAHLMGISRGVVHRVAHRQSYNEVE